MAQTHKSLQGQLLLDGGKLHGSFFHRTVVLICRHNVEGAFGLILNRASERTVGEALVANLPDEIKEQSLFVGGPVQPDSLSYLHTDTFVLDANVMPNLSVGHSLDTLMDLGESFANTKKLKLFGGYAGWTAGQLDQEMARHDWLTHPASLELIFFPDPARLWKSILCQKGDQCRLLAESPDDLSWN
jgi:putative transcriptional regulator